MKYVLLSGVCHSGALLIGHMSAPLAGAVDLPTCPFADVACVRTALVRYAGLAITGVPGLAAARRSALMELASCALHGEETRHVVLPDRTVRHTVAAETVRGVPSEIDAGGCEGLPEAADPLRALVDQSVRRVLGGLEGLVRTDSGPLLPAAERAGGYATLGEVAQQGLHLEHFHAYKGGGGLASKAAGGEKGGAGVAAAGDESAAPTVPLHTDAGLLIAVVPPLYVAPGAAKFPLPPHSRVPRRTPRPLWQPATAA